MEKYTLRTLAPSRPFSVAHALWLVALPLFDATTCIIRRICEGVTPMTPDQRHIHHLLIELGLKPKLVAPALNALAAAFAAIGIFIWQRGVNDIAALYALVLAFVGYVCVILRIGGSSVQRSAQAAQLSRASRD